MRTRHKYKRWGSLHRYQSERSSCSSGKVPPSAVDLYPVYSYQRVASEFKAVNPLLCQAERSDPLDMVMISAGVAKTRITSARAKTKRVRTPMFVVPGIVSYPCHSNKSKNPDSGEGDHPYGDRPCNTNKSEKKPGYGHRQTIAVSQKCRIGTTSS